MGLSGPEVDNLRLTLVSVEQGDVGILHSLGIKVHTVSMVHSRIDRIRGRVCFYTVIYYLLVMVAARW